MVINERVEKLLVCRKFEWLVCEVYAANYVALFDVVLVCSECYLIFFGGFLIKIWELFLGFGRNSIEGTEWRV